MKAYRIWYYAPIGVNDLDDVYIAESKLEAIKKFLIQYKGRYNVHSVIEI